MINGAELESLYVAFLCVCSLTFDAVLVILPLQWSAPQLLCRVQEC